MEESTSDGPFKEAAVENTSFLNSAVGAISSYGWFILFVAVSFIYLWRRFVESRYNDWQGKRDQDSEATQVARNPDAFLAQQMALEASRLRLQEKLDADALKYKETIKLKEEAKKREKLKTLESMESVRKPLARNSSEGMSGNSGSSKTKKDSSLRGDYNPLMGSSSSTCYRPSRRGGTGGGG